MVSSPRYHDITGPEQDLEWRTGYRLFASLAVLAGVLGSAIYVLTPHARRFFQSPEFTPVLLGGAGVFILLYCAKALLSERITPLLRGTFGPYEREEQPKRFWLSFAFNACLGAASIFGAVEIVRNLGPDTCQNRFDQYKPHEQIAACNRMLARDELSEDERAKYVRARGRAYHVLGEDDAALADYSLAIELGPGDPYVYYNRALMRQHGEETESALAYYDRFLEEKPDNFLGHFRRGVLRLNSAQFGGAIADFTRAHEIDPDDEWTLANRGMSYAWMNESGLAEKDFAAAAKIDPENPVLLRGRALLHMQAKEFPQAVAVLDKVLENEPNDYWELGEKEKSWADGDLALELDVQKTRSASDAQLLPSN